MTKYKVIVGSDKNYQAFEDEVNQAIKDSFVPIGGVSTQYNSREGELIYSQAMLKN